MEKKQPIDFVIAWADGSDPAWQKEKAQFLRPGESTVQFDATDLRYRAWDDLRYWFRAVETYAPWVNRIHFVTWGHLPQWLNLSAPKLNIVKHSDFIPKEYLPTFSSHPIELNLHRIPDLSDCFVYFNDDFFLTAPTKPEDFFVDGLPCDSLEETPITFYGRTIMNSINTNDIIFMSEHFNRQECRAQHRNKWFNLRDPHAMAKNFILSVLNDHRFFGVNIHHLPQAYRKETLEAVWMLEPELLAKTSSHYFRNEEDVSQCVFKFWQLMTGNFYPYNKRKNGKWLNSDEDMEEICQIIRGRKYKMLCINDSPDIDFESTEKQLNAAFESVLPDKSSFEK